MSDTIQDMAAAASAAFASKMATFGAATAVVTGFISTNWVGIGGLLIGLTGMLIKWYYLHQDFKRRRDKPAVK
jgi:hypothetical protein